MNRPLASAPSLNMVVFVCFLLLTVLDLFKKHVLKGIFSVSFLFVTNHNVQIMTHVQPESLITERLSSLKSSSILLSRFELK